MKKILDVIYKFILIIQGIATITIQYSGAIM
jgi:hypothetical protein